MYLEDDLLQLSALQYFLFCPQQCVLIHIEQVWIENLFTAEGRVIYKNVDEQRQELQGGIKIERGLLLRSLCLGLSGKADVIKFHKRGNEWIPYPIEYKRSKSRPSQAWGLKLENKVPDTFFPNTKIQIIYQ